MALVWSTTFYSSSAVETELPGRHKKFPMPHNLSNLTLPEFWSLYQEGDYSDGSWKLRSLPFCKTHTVDDLKKFVNSSDV
jgi:hypothetical protein